LQRSDTYDWQFPLPRTHTGILQGNGTFGAIVWGEANVLKITLNRADFWDHRGGLAWNERMNFATIRDLLLQKDEQRLYALFQQAEVPPGEPTRPSVLPLGRIECVFPSEIQLSSGSLHVENGAVTVRLLDADNITHEVIIHLSMNAPLLHVRLPEDMPFPLIRRVTAWEYVGEYLKSISFEEPYLLDKPELEGWVQQRPADPPLCLGYRKADHQLWVTAVYGKNVEGSIAEATRLLDEAGALGVEQLKADNARWWSAYWEKTPQIAIPNQKLSFLYYYGMYKFAGLTAPQGTAATLQGPWVEEYQMPPWSSDYHFNINVQMCYWPAYSGNHLEHLRPLFDMVWSWRDTLRQNAHYFIGIDDGFMLPHAVDDRCTGMGGFWTGAVDHGCTAWVAKMMYDYWLYGGDQEFLSSVAYPFMVGAMRVYEAMLQREGDQFMLPLSVSPEYRGKQINAWGENASFQLACIHWLCEALQTAAAALGEQPRPIWREIQQKLPQACVEGEPGREMIMLWHGTPLEESHRHHSHLAGLTPFDVLDRTDPAWQPIIERSINHWIKQGMGMWSGWCIPWASMIHTRMDHADAAELLLEIWDRVYTNEGHGTLHDVHFPGFSLIGASRSMGRKEIMQIEAGMAVTAAILEMLLHTRRGIHYFFIGAPSSWPNASFSNIRTEGGFLVSARRSAGQTREVQIVAEKGGLFRLANPWTDRVVVTRGDSKETISGPILQIETQPGEVITLRTAF